MLPQKKISLLIADPMAISSELLTQALSRRPDFMILGCPKNLDELIVSLRRSLQTSQSSVVPIRRAPTLDWRFLVPFITLLRIPRPSFFLQTSAGRMLLDIFMLRRAEYSQRISQTLKPCAGAFIQ